MSHRATPTFFVRLKATCPPSHRVHAYSVLPARAGAAGACPGLPTAAAPHSAGGVRVRARKLSHVDTVAESHSN